MRYSVSTEGVSYSIDIDDSGQRVVVDGQAMPVDLVQVNPPALFSLLVGGRSHEVFLEEVGKGEYRVVIGGELCHVRVVTDRDARLRGQAVAKGRPTGEVHVKAPMPGVVRAVEVALGDAVRSRQGLIVLEAMKMENEIRAAQAGTVRSISVVKGQRVEQGQTLLVIAA
jgi:biotin carboxyl carrier protein